MTPTIIRGLRQRNIDSADLTYWANKELIPLVAQLVQAANYVNRVQASIQTAGTGVFTTIWSSDDLARNSVVRFDASVVATENPDRAIFTVTALFYNDGTVNQEGATVNGPTINVPGYSVRYLVVGNHIALQVQDAGATTNFTATIDAVVVVGP